MGYRKPTLTETLAEINLEPGLLTEARFFDVVPRLQALGFAEIEFASAGISFEPQPGRMGFPKEKQRVRCWRPGRTELAQVSEDLLVMNLTGDYPGWDRFIRLFDEGVGALHAGLGEAPIRSVNLQTIDRFQVPRDGFAVSEYLNTSGEIIPQWYAECRESLDMTLGRGFLQLDGKNRQVVMGVRTVADPVTVQIQATFHDAVREGENLRELLERLHDESNETFELLITDRTRNEVMGGRVK